MSAHTQWLIVDDVPSSHIGYRAIVDSDGTIVCNPSPMGEDNARLIAAAPELLAALRDIVTASSANCGDSLANAIQTGRAAIAKAEA